MFSMNCSPNSLRRSACCQKRQTGVAARMSVGEPQPPDAAGADEQQLSALTGGASLPQHDAAGTSLCNGLANQPAAMANLMAKPPNSPMATAATALAMANGQPSALAVMSSDGGSISGEDSQNAITADSGAPSASRPATNGITSQEQNGASPPNSAA